VDINVQDFTGKTPLYHAAKHGYHEIVALLLGTGQVDVNAENDSGWNSILPAFLGGHLKIVKSLLDNGWGIHTAPTMLTARRRDFPCVR
jgi:ankyrin repeat protein